MQREMEEYCIQKKKVYCIYENFFCINVMVTTKKHSELKHLTYKMMKQRENNHRIP